jgi:CHAT domain-containing protein/tetratricopeptide (TPR) repeat protein
MPLNLRIVVVPLLVALFVVNCVALGSEEHRSSLNKQVSELTDAGKYSEALPLAKEALAETEADLGANDVEVAKAANNLGWLLQAQGDYTAARPQFERALKINESVLGADNPEVATCLNNLASLMSFQGDYAAAKPLYERALAINEKALGAEHIDVAKSLNNLAVTMEALRKPEQAQALYERALSIADKQGAESIDVANSLNNLASIFVSQEKVAEARPLLERALQIKQKILGEDHPDLGESLNNLAMVVKRQGDLDAAKPLLERALKIYEATEGPEHLDVATTLNNLGEIDWYQKNYDQARERFLRGAKIVNSHIENVLPALSIAEQRAFLDSRVPGEISLLLSTCREGSSLERAYDYVYKWKGLLINSLRTQREIARLGKQPAHQAPVRALQEVREKIARWYQEAGNAPYDEWKAENDQLTARKEDLERQLIREVKPGSVSDVLAAKSAMEFAKFLKADEAFVDVYRYQSVGPENPEGQRYVAVISLPGKPAQLADLGEAKVTDALIRAWRKEVLVRNLAAAQWEDLAEHVWKPVAAALPAGPTRVWLSPDSELSRLPWHVFLQGDTRRAGSMLAQVDSARELAIIRVAAPDTVAVEHPVILIAGGIDFGGKMPQLPGTVTEIGEIRQMAQQQGMLVKFLSVKEPSKQRIIPLLSNSHYVHLATHGFFAKEPAVERSSSRSITLKPREVSPTGPMRNPLVESGIALADGPSGPYLTAEELLGLDLQHCKLMTLSACETGLGEEVTGQGVMGLRAAIMAAGAKTILMSLWKVPDAPTLKIMDLFYKNLWGKHMPPVKALAQAQDAVRNEQFDRYKAPVNWAPWVLVGEGW